MDGLIADAGLAGDVRKRILVSFAKEGAVCFSVNSRFLYSSADAILPPSAGPKFAIQIRSSKKPVRALAPTG